MGRGVKVGSGRKWWAGVQEVVGRGGGNGGGGTQVDIALQSKDQGWLKERSGTWGGEGGVLLTLPAWTALC